MASVGELQVELTADSAKLEREMNGLFGPGGRLAGGMMAVGTAAVAAGAAIAGFGAAGVKEFAEFEKGMNEVYTLLPGISESTMKAMEDDLLDFSKEMGVASDEAVPALYSALSAGVPQDNVFEFLKTAQELAVAGVSTTETAVDALSSAVNAYGSDILTAEEASDSMLTAVRLGKTTIDELAGAMSNVAPIAASLGVPFDDINAALAAMTAQGEPTASASTKIRQALAELSKEGSAAYDQFLAIADESFPEFIEGGGTFQEALNMMADTADMTGGRITDSFGSIEAGMAAQMLTSDTGRETFTSNLDEMADKAGATETAFGTMESGIGHSWDRMTASFETLMIKVGDKLAPMFQDAVDIVVDDVFPKLEDIVLGVFTAIQGATATMTTKWEEWRDDSDSILNAVISVGEALGETFDSVFNALATLWTEVLWPVWKEIEPLVTGAFNAISELITGVLETIESLMRAFVAFMEGDWDTAWNEMNNAVQAIMDGLEGAIKAVWEGIEEFLGNLITRTVDAALDTWERLKTNIITFTEGMRDSVQSVMDSLSEAVDTAFSGLGELARDGLNGVKDAWDWLVGVLDTAMGHLETMFGGLGQALGDTLRGGFGSALDWLRDQVNSVISAINNFIGTLNSALEISIPSISASIPDWVPGVGGKGFTIDFPSINPPDIRPIPHLAEGGIVDGPTLAMVGEAGPEAVIPLNQMGNFTDDQHVTVWIDLDGDRIAESTLRRSGRILRFHGA